MIVRGAWQKGKSIFDVADSLREGDVILKGANALDPAKKQAAVLIGHPRGGTTLTILPAVVGRRARLILPVGLEKRIAGDLMELAARLNGPGRSGFRLLPVPCEVFTEIEAIHLLTGAEAELVAGRGVGGAEGAVWMTLIGSEVEMRRAEGLMREVSAEKEFEL